MPPIEGFNDLLDELPVPGVDRQSCRLLGPTALVRLACGWGEEGVTQAAGVGADRAGDYGRDGHPLVGL